MTHCHHAGILASRLSQIDHNICWFDKTACLNPSGYQNWSSYWLFCTNYLSYHDWLLYHHCFFYGVMVRLVWLVQKLPSCWSYFHGLLLLSGWCDHCYWFLLSSPTLVLDVCAMFRCCFSCPRSFSLLTTWLT